METAWMGRYRSFVAELVRHSNITSKASSVKQNFNGFKMTFSEWQVLEYIVEHRFDDDRMIHISETLEIPQSTFSRTVKNLCAAGLVDKYQMTNNRKNIILKPTELGIKLYKESFRDVSHAGFDQFFEALGSVSDEDLETVTNALRILNNYLKDGILGSNSEISLVKME